MNDALHEREEVAISDHLDHNSEQEVNEKHAHEEAGDKFEAEEQERKDDQRQNARSARRVEKSGRQSAVEALRGGQFGFRHVHWSTFDGAMPAKLALHAADGARGNAELAEKLLALVTKETTRRLGMKLAVPRTGDSASGGNGSWNGRRSERGRRCNCPRGRDRLWRNGAHSRGGRRL